MIKLSFLNKEIMDKILHSMRQARSVSLRDANGVLFGAHGSLRELTVEEKEGLNAEIAAFWSECNPEKKPETVDEKMARNAARLKERAAAAILEDGPKTGVERMLDL